MADETEMIHRRLQEAVDNMIKSISASRINPMQKQCYLKMADCCDLKDENQMQRCLETNQIPLKISQNIIQNEMNQLQDRVQRCSASCMDTVKDTLGNNANFDDPKVQQKAQNIANKCMLQCVDKHVALLKGIQAKILADIDAKAKAP